MTPIPDAFDHQLGRIALRLGAVDATDTLETAVLLAELREGLETVAGQLGEAFGALVSLESLINAAEAADVLDRTGLFCLLRLDLADFVADFLAPDEIAA